MDFADQGSHKPRHEEEADTKSVPPGTLAWEATAGAELDPPPPTGDNNNNRGSELIFQFPFDQGGTGEIWQAVQASLKRVVAVKRVLPEHYRRHQEEAARVNAMERRFREEARITASLEHPNIVPVYDLSSDEDGHPLLVMKLVNGTPWLRLLRQDIRSMDYESYLARHLTIFISMMQAVAFAHSRGIIHMDLKPSQVMVGEFGETLLMDWGLATTADALPNGGRLPVPAGTPVMMSPEQAGAEDFPVGFHTDIFLLGGTLYFILTNQYPHDANNTPKAVELARAGKIRHPEELMPGTAIPPALTELAMKAMSFNPENRPTAVSELVKAVEDYLSGAAIRREAEQIVEEVRDGMKALGLDRSSKTEPHSPDLAYQALASFQSRLLYAAGLWRKAPGLALLRDEVATAYFRVALAAGDLRLATTTLTAIEDEKVRDRLGEELGESQHRIRQRALLFRMTAIAAVSLGLALGIGAFRYALDMREASLRVMQERDAAEEARRSAVKAHEATIAERNALDLARRKAEREQYLASIRLIERNIQDLRIREAENQLALVANQSGRGPEWGLLASRLATSEITLWRVDPPARLHYAQFSPDGTRIVTGDNDGNVIVWESVTGRRIRQARVATGGIWFALYTPDGKRLLVTSFDTKARIIDADTLEVIHTLEGHTQLLRGAAISPDGKRAVTTSQDATAIMWDMETGAKLYSAPDITARTSSADFAPDGKRFVLAGSNFATIRDSETGAVIHNLPRHDENILDVDISPDGTRVVTACTDRNIRIFDMEDGSLVKLIPNRTSWLHSVQFSPSGKELVSSDNDGTLRLWDAASGEMQKEFSSPAQAYRVRFSPDGKRIVSSSATQISVWSALGLQGHSYLEPSRETITADSNLTMIRAFGIPLESGVARSEQWDKPGRRLFDGPGGSLVLAHSYYLAPAPDRQHGVWISPQDGSASLRTVPGLESIATIPGGPYYDAAWSLDSARIFMGAVSGEVVAWNKESLTPEAVLLPAGLPPHKPGHYPTVMTVSADGSMLAVVRPDEIVHLFDARTLREIRSIDYDDGSAAYVALSPDATLLAVGGHSYRSRLYDTRTGELVCTTTGHEGVVSGGFFWKDGSRLVTWGADDRVIMHETQGGSEVTTIANVSGREGVIGVGVTPDWSAILLQLNTLQVYSYPILPSATIEPGVDQGMEIARQLEAFKRSQRLGREVSVSEVDWSVPPLPTNP
ncbi:protein kinase [bacterium]|nr:protein kinase [bacterium]